MSRSKEEFHTQVAIIDFLARFPQHEQLKWTHHIPNGGSRNPREAMNLKRSGVLSGVADLCNPLTSADGKYKGVYLEIKSKPTTYFDKAGKPKKYVPKTSPEQKAFLERMTQDGWRCEVVTDWVEGVRILFDHFGIQYPIAFQNALIYARR